jgi:hypothetical protein
VHPIAAGTADVVFGSRLKDNPRQSALAQGMPWWKFVSNKALTWLENRVFGLGLSEFHTGYRVYSRRALEHVNYQANADGFIFDQEIVAQVVGAGFRISEIAVPTRYFAEASSASFGDSVVYGLKILSVLFWYSLHRRGIRRSRRFDSLRGRYTRLTAPPSRRAGGRRQPTTV